ncbi:hypothetical protein [Oleisolibacter albus]|uniref:hypothetical protein n=1 Tax=Oleisolibacter albus TaxID=2171757 RepID=UPI000DF11B4B|nr:hypothetical protein [Oleisolibacter albus]
MLTPDATDLTNDLLRQLLDRSQAAGLAIGDVMMMLGIMAGAVASQAQPDDRSAAFAILLEAARATDEAVVAAVSAIRLH